MSEKKKAWGPERETFTWEKPAKYPVFNSITNNPKIGDERNFTRIREKKEGEKFSSSVDVEIGRTYEVAFWIHNNASQSSGGLGTATGVRLKAECPKLFRANTTAVIRGCISAQNTDPIEVWDTAYFHSKEDVYLELIKGSGILHCIGELNNTRVDESALFSESGMPVTVDKNFLGTIPSSEELSRCYITVDIRVVEAKQ